MISRLGQAFRFWILLLAMGLLAIGTPIHSVAAPYAALVMDARTGQVIHARNADTRLHPASLTKMMTLYLAFQAVERGEISLDTEVTITADAAAQPPSKLGLRTGQRIRLRYLIRAAAIKSANDAATAIGIALDGSTPAFARRMNRMAESMGMTRTTFRNANGLTEDGHLSTARDMTELGRHLLYDYPQYYNIFSRLTADAGMAQVANTNRRFLSAYSGADGIKTGYTRAAGFNLVASAQRGNERIIATVFGGSSTADRNARVADLLDMGFREAPSNARLQPPRLVAVAESQPEVVVGSTDGAQGLAGKTIRVTGQVTRSLRPRSRSSGETVAPEELLVAEADVINDALAIALQAVVETAAAEPEAIEVAVAEVAAPEPEALAADAEDAPLEAEDATLSSPLAPATVATLPRARPETVIPAAAENTENAEPAVTVASAEPAAPEPEQLVEASIVALRAPALFPARPAEPEVVTRISTSGGRHWGINVGRYNTRYEAERVLLRIALNEMSSLDGTLRRVTERSGGYDANFVGLSQEGADLACRRLTARGLTCQMIGDAS